MEAKRTFHLSTLIALAGILAGGPRSAVALDEFFETYLAPQALAMGNAFTADATGWAALFHNPAGLAKATTTKWDITPLALDLNFSTGFLGTSTSAGSAWAVQLYPKLQENPGRYNYFRGALVPAFTRRNFGIALLGSYEFAAVSDGTEMDIQTGTDRGIVVGTSSNFAANMLKIGVSGKALIRNQLKGVYDHTVLSGDLANAQLSKEGLGFGADVGLMLTVPLSYLPTLGVVWKDILGTYFRPTQFVNPHSTGAPDSIPQTIHAAFSIHPAFGRAVRTSFSVELRHIQLSTIALRKRLHFGVQFITNKRLYLWLGMNQLFPTAGVGLRVQGGDLELSTYAQDIGVGEAVEADRRFVLRYTIGF